jgi:hypothetical protein
VRFLAHETSVASAATCDIGAAAGLKVAVTGTTAIASFGTQPNRLKFVRFAGALTLTHHATSLILPGAANIATAAGDTAIFASDASGNWRCWHYSNLRNRARRANVLAPHEGLIVRTTSVSMVDIDAEAVELFDADGNAKQLAMVDLTADITISGKNGCGSGISESSSTWYYLFVGEDGGTPYCWLDTSTAGANDPDSSSAFRGLVGAIYNDGSGNFISIFQRGRDVSRTNHATLTNGTATTYTAISLAAVVPVIATSVFGSLGVNTSAGSTNVFCALATHASVGTTTPTYGEEWFQSGNAIGANNLYQRWEVLMHTGHQIFYYILGANGQVTIKTTGWRF